MNPFIVFLPLLRIFILTQRAVALRTMSLLFIGLITCTLPTYAGGHGHGHGSHEEKHEDPKGPNGGKLFTKDGITLELAIVETGLPPEFRAWLTKEAQTIDLTKAQLTVRLERLGGVIDQIEFTPESHFLRGQNIVTEPHSFVINIDLRYQGQRYTWQAESFEGRTQIKASIANELQINTETVGSQQLFSSVSAVGRLTHTPSQVQAIAAQYDGIVTALHVKRGDKVKAKQALLRVRSKDSLNEYTVYAPIAGEIIEQRTNVGEFSQGQTLLTLHDLSSFQAELRVFPRDLSKVSIGTPVILSINGVDNTFNASVDYISHQTNTDQSVSVFVTLPNNNNLLRDGQFVRSTLITETFEVPLAVKRSALQPFRDFTVVYAKYGEYYEVRMLTLGRRSGEWVEVLSGIDAGTEYVVDNSYIIKADIEKAGAAHDH